MDEPPVGRFWGSVYRSDQVTSIGPDADGRCGIVRWTQELAPVSADAGTRRTAVATSKAMDS